MEGGLPKEPEMKEKEREKGNREIDGEGVNVRRSDGFQ